LTVVRESDKKIRYQLVWTDNEHLLHSALPRFIDVVVQFSALVLMVELRMLGRESGQG